MINFCYFVSLYRNGVTQIDYYLDYFNLILDERYKSI